MRAAITAVALVLLSLPAGAAAATFRVTRSDDPAPGACTAASCSLREAVRASNDNGPGADVIRAGRADYRLTRGQLAVRGSLRLAGAGARHTVIDPSASPGQNRALDIVAPGNAKVTVSSLTITGGDLVDRDGGGIFLQSRAATLALDRVEINVNEAFNGAGVRADGRLLVSRSTFFADHALGVTKGSGAAIAFRRSGRGRIVNSTFVGSHGPNRGGAIDYSPSRRGVLAILNSTIADNHADGRGGGVAAFRRGTVIVRNTIVARNTINKRSDRGRTGTNCIGRIRSAGHNLEGPLPPNPFQQTGGRSCPFHARGDRRGLDPGLRRTQNNGGPTDTREPRRDSPARGHATRCPRIDQRGIRRGRRCDVGAVEYTRRREGVQR